jgi:aminoglycoside/choline kinase family phosphotransferase
MADPVKDPATVRRVREAVAVATHKDTEGMPVKRLAGHASNRSYWRVGTFGEGSHTVMVLPPEVKPEEVTKTTGSSELPFVNVQRYLKTIGVRVPEIVAWYVGDGLMVLEDLGDDMLETQLLKGVPREKLYQQAIDALAALRMRAEKKPDEGCVAFNRSFDEELYLWELEHFIEWGLEAGKGKKLGKAERAVVTEEFAKIGAALAKEPRGFTHRDYQSRNLMVLPHGELCVIDFQDALLGPRQYDLVALLRDSYVTLDQPFIDEMLRRYLDRLAEHGVPREDFAAFRATFDLLTIQRKLKDAGRFVFIDRVKKNPGFLVSIPASLAYVREAFARRPDLSRLQEVLAGHVPELAP